MSRSTWNQPQPPPPRFTQSARAPAGPISQAEWDSITWRGRAFDALRMAARHRTTGDRGRAVRECLMLARRWHASSLNAGEKLP